MAKTNVWLSVSDLMTGLMIIFLFIAIAYIMRVKDNQSVLSEFVENKKELHDKLENQFEQEIKDGELSIKGDLSLRFENAETLFPSGSWQLTDRFQQSLSVFLPKYLEILLNDSLRYKIKEIRIEGHTDDVAAPQLHPDPYMANLILSQRRALSVMEYIRSIPEFQKYNEEEKKLLEYWFTANGFSYGRALDKNNDFALATGDSIVRNKSRRVEFRIITSGEEVLENFVKENK